MKHVKIALTIIGGLVGLYAAWLWWKATKITAPPTDEVDSSGWQPARIVVTSDDGSAEDVLKTARAQTLWNRKAAIATGVSVLLTSIASLLPDGS